MRGGEGGGEFIKAFQVKEKNYTHMNETSDTVLKELCEARLSGLEEKSRQVAQKSQTKRSRWFLA